MLRVLVLIEADLSGLMTRYKIPLALMLLALEHLVCIRLPPQDHIRMMACR